MNLAIRLALIGGLAQLGALTVAPPPARAASAEQISIDAQQALDRLYANSDKARDLSGRAKAILVFPHVLKAALLVGAQTGNGVLLEHGRPVRYYNISAASFGFQAGGKEFSYALFFMNRDSLAYLKRSDGWAIGTGPSVVVVDKGFARSASSTTLTQDVYAFPFGQRGLMGGIGLEGSKITRYTPDN